MPCKAVSCSFFGRITWKTAQRAAAAVYQLPIRAPGGWADPACRRVVPHSFKMHRNCKGHILSKDDWTGCFPCIVPYLLCWYLIVLFSGTFKQPVVLQYQWPIWASTSDLPFVHLGPLTPGPPTASSLWGCSAVQCSAAVLWPAAGSHSPLQVYFHFHSMTWANLRVNGDLRVFSLDKQNPL